MGRTPRRPEALQVREVLTPVLGWLDGHESLPPRPALATAVRVSLRTFAARYPGRAVEVRVPPFAAVQCLAGGTHTRGTPPHVVQADARTWLALLTGRTDWARALADGALEASGHRAAEVGALLPMALDDPF